MVVAAGCSGNNGSASPSTGSTSTVGKPESTQQTVAALAAVGVATVADEKATAPQVAVTGPTVYTVTALQAANMTQEAAAGGGITGTDLDAVVPMHGAPPMAYVVGGWVLEANDPAAAAAARLVGPVDWNHAADVVFPTEVLTLFVGDVAQHMATPGSDSPTTTGPTSTGSTTAAGSAAGTPGATPARLEVARPDAAPILTSPCSTIANFFNDILNQVFNALKLDPAAVSDWVSGKLGGGTLGAIAGTFAGWFASAWNHAVDLARTAVQTVLTQLTQPVLNILRLAIGAIATLTTLVSYLKPWKAPITADPPANQFGIVGGAARTGAATVAIDKNAEIAQWPPLLASCAQTFNITLPTLSRSGLPVTWEVDEPESLVTVDHPSGPSFAGTLNDDLKSTMQYTTQRESAKLAKTGDPVVSDITVVARVRRTEVDDLRQMVTDFVTAQVPGFLKTVLDPIIASYLEWATKFLDILINVEGSLEIPITHHVPKPPKPPAPTTASSAPPPTSGPGPAESNAKCTDLTDAAASAAVGQVTTVTLDGPVTLAGLTICKVTVANLIDPIQLDVNTHQAAAYYRVEKGINYEAVVAGIGDDAFQSAIGIEALSDGVDVRVVGPAEPILLHHDFTIPTALAKAMVAAVK